MNHGPWIFLGVFAALATSWFGMIVQPQLQLGRAVPGTNVVDTAARYPQARSGLAQQGLQVYRSLGCVTCHSQQVRQDGVTLNVVLTSAGTNQPAVVEAIHALRADLPKPEGGRMLERLPVSVLSGLKDPEAAQAAVKRLVEAGAKAQVQLLAHGPDIDRGWGRGRSVATDFLYDRPAMPGTIRLGPDLANAGARLLSADWHYVHLYDPRGVVENTVMPPYRFLFERRKVGEEPSPLALRLGDAAAQRVGEGYEILPTDDAVALVAYLLSLRSDVPLLERPLGSEAGSTTNAPAGETNTVSNPTTNRVAAP